jgi:hypothetical protein
VQYPEVQTPICPEKEKEKRGHKSGTLIQQDLDPYKRVGTLAQAVREPT